MRPETGDRSIQVFTADVVAAAREVEIVPGDVVIFHSSLSSMGTVVDGPNTFINGLLEAVGPTGTVAAPTLWYHQADPPMDISEWDIDNSPSYPGALTEALRTRPDSLRSNNPSHSVSAIGARAEELTRDHGKSGLRPCVFGDTAFAVESPWERLYQWNAAYCFVGVDFTANTMGHYCETRFAEMAVQDAPEEIRADLEGRLKRRQVPGVWPSHSFQRMGERLAEMGLVRFSTIGSATLRCVRAREMVDTILAILHREPDEWFGEEFLAWLKEARGR